MAEDDLARVLTPVDEEQTRRTITESLNHHAVPIELQAKILSAAIADDADDATLILTQLLARAITWQPLAPTGRIMLVGPHGAGKTAAAARLAVDMLMTGAPVVVIDADAARAGATAQLAALLDPIGVVPLRADSTQALAGLARRRRQLHHRWVWREPVPRRGACTSGGCGSRSTGGARPGTAGRARSFRQRRDRRQFRGAGNQADAGHQARLCKTAGRGRVRRDARSGRRRRGDRPDRRQGHGAPHSLGVGTTAAPSLERATPAGLIRWLTGSRALEPPVFYVWYLPMWLHPFNQPSILPFVLHFLLLLTAHSILPRTTIYIVFVIIAWVIAGSPASAQTYKIKGYVFDSTRRYPLELVSVLSTSGQGTVTNADGFYEIEVVEKDSIYFSYLNKPTIKFPVIKISNPSDFQISLQINVPILKEVKIRQRNYKLDSIQNRLDYAKVFNYQKPGLSTSTSNFGAGVGFDLDELINVFRFRRNRSLASMQKRLLAEEEDKFVDHRFNKALVRKLTSLDGNELDSFMRVFRPPYPFTLVANDYDFLEYIKIAHDRFERGLPPMPAMKEDERYEKAF